MPRRSRSRAIGLRARSAAFARALRPVIGRDCSMRFSVQKSACSIHRARPATTLSSAGIPVRRQPRHSPNHECRDGRPLGITTSIRREWAGRQANPRSNNRGRSLSLPREIWSQSNPPPRQPQPRCRPKLNQRSHRRPIRPPMVRSSCRPRLAVGRQVRHRHTRRHRQAIQRLSTAMLLQRRCRLPGCRWHFRPARIHPMQCPPQRRLTRLNTRAVFLPHIRRLHRQPSHRRPWAVFRQAMAPTGAQLIRWHPWRFTSRRCPRRFRQQA